jgi:uncharacterized membrane protein
VRYVSIDLLRTVAIVLMVVVHFMENLAGADWAPAGLGAPLFTFLVGVSYRLWLNAQQARGIDEAKTSKTSIRRGLFLFVLGFAFNLLVWLPEDTFNWDVLTLIGASLIVLNLVRNLPLPVPLLLAVMAFVLGPLLRELTDYSSYWTGGYFDPDLTLSDVLTGFLANGFFPLFPWVAYPLVGFVTGALFFSNEPGEPAPTGRAALIGAGLLALSLSAVLLRRWLSAPPAILKGWTMFPPTMEYVTGTLGLVLLSFSLAHRWLDPNPWLLERVGLLRVVTTFSKYSLSMYLLHHVVHLWPMWIYGAAVADEPTQFWRGATSVTAAIALSVLCLAAGYGVFRWMERTQLAGIEAWMRYLCD